MMTIGRTENALMLDADTEMQKYLNTCTICNTGNLIIDLIDIIIDLINHSTNDLLQ